MTWYLETERLKLRAIDSTDRVSLRAQWRPARHGVSLAIVRHARRGRAILPSHRAQQALAEINSAFRATEKGSEEFNGTSS